MPRFAAAAADGFDAVEYLYPCAFSPEEVAEPLRVHGLKQVLFNMPPGDAAAREQGMGCLPGRQEEFAQHVLTALRYAQATGCTCLHAMAGRMPAGIDMQAMTSIFVANLRQACDVLALHGITVMIEPLNERDNPGYFLSRQAQAHDIVQAVGRDNLKVQMHFYHCQISEGNVSKRLPAHWPGVGHIQTVGVPERHEPDSGELNSPLFLSCSTSWATQVMWAANTDRAWAHRLAWAGCGAGRHRPACRLSENESCLNASFPCLTNAAPPGR